MTVRRALSCAALVAFASAGWAADKPATAKKSAQPAAAKPSRTAAKAPAKPAVKTSAKPAARKSAKSPAPARPSGIVQTSLKPSAPPQSPVLRGKTEVLTCRDGTEDRHARIALVLVGGKTDGFAYYSKWKPRTCSIYLQRNRDAHSKWSDSGTSTNVNVERGQFTIEHRKNEYRLVFRDVDRERYCGMDGTINGTLTIRKGSQHCDIAGIMEEGVPLGQAYAHLESGAAASQGTAMSSVATASSAGGPPAAAARESSSLGFFARLFQRRTQPTFPSAAAGSSD